MARELKVFSGWLIRQPGTVPGETRPQVQAVVAATSQAAVAEATRSTRGHIQTYWSVTANADDVAQAMSEPGVVFLRGMHAYGGEWVRDEKP